MASALARFADVRGKAGSHFPDHAASERDHGIGTPICNDFVHELIVLPLFWPAKPV
jgi:hypothetical protein